MLSIILDNCRNPSFAGAATTVEGEAELLADEAEDDTLGAGGGSVRSEKVL